MHAANEAADTLLSIPFSEGRRAALERYSAGINPYPAGSAEAVQWQLGHQSVTVDSAFREILHTRRVA